MPVAYRIQNLTKVYKGSQHKANNNLTLDIHTREIFGLLGSNGAGKSTLVRQICGLLLPTSGSIYLFGIDVVKKPDLISHYVALQPPYSSALWNLYPEEAIFYTGLFRDLSTSDARKQTKSLMEELKLDQIPKKQIINLSEGQRKLIALAVAFVADRPVQVFDEPTDSLDPAMRRLVWEKLLRQNQQGITIILVTHNVLEAERVIQRVGIINNGNLIALGTPSELKSRIDQRIRLDLLFKAEATRYCNLLESLGDVQALTSQHWSVLCYPDSVRDAIDLVLAQIGLDQLEDFRILTPSLEDVYLQLGGSNLGK